MDNGSIKALVIGGVMVLFMIFILILMGVTALVDGSDGVRGMLHSLGAFGWFGASLLIFAAIALLMAWVFNMVAGNARNAQISNDNFDVAKIEAIADVLASRSKADTAQSRVELAAMRAQRQIAGPAVPDVVPFDPWADDQVNDGQFRVVE